MLKILYLCLPKNTLRLFGMEMMITKKLHCRIQILEMLNPCFTIDVDIIKEYQNEVSQVGPKYFIHQCLECGRRICEAKWHDQKFIMAIMCAESCFRDIILLNPNLLIPRTKIHEHHEAHHEAHQQHELETYP